MAILITKNNRANDVQLVLSGIVEPIYELMKWTERSNLYAGNLLTGLITMLDKEPELMEVGHQHLRVHRLDPMIYEVLISPRVLINYAKFAGKGKTEKYEGAGNTSKRSKATHQRDKKLSVKQQRILDYIKSKGLKGVTDAELRHLNPASPTSPGRMRTTLTDDFGSVVRTNLRRMSPANHKVVVWVAREHYVEELPSLRWG